MDLSLNLIHSSATVRSAASAAEDPGCCILSGKSKLLRSSRNRDRDHAVTLDSPELEYSGHRWPRRFVADRCKFDIGMSCSNEFCRQCGQAGKRRSAIYAKDQLPCFLRSLLTHSSLQRAKLIVGKRARMFHY